MKLYDKHGNEHVLVDGGYRDIKNELLFTKDNFVSIDKAYIENGIICITGSIFDGSSGTYTIQLLPDKYTTRYDTFGYISYDSSKIDMGKIQAVWIKPNGELHIWIGSTLNYRETFSIMYPLKS